MKRRTWIGAVAATLALGASGLAIAQEGTGALSVTEILLGTELSEGVPTTPGTSFSRFAGTIYCVVRLANPTGAESAVRIGFEAATGEPAARVAGFRLDVPAQPRYRTVGRTSSSRAPGRYRCVVRTDEGAVLSHADFDITE